MSNNEVIDKEVRASDDDEASPAELLSTHMDDRYSREFTIADDGHPLVITAGSKEELKSSVPPRVHRMLSDELYQDPDVFWREWTQNHVAACLREAQRVVKHDHPDGKDALCQTIEHDHPELEDTRTIQLPKPQREILWMARDLGYDPTIEYIVDADTRKVTTIDNGIGMTTAEAIEAWNEPVQSGSGTDQLSAGTKGIGALTWFAIGGDDALAMVKTRTRREETFSGTPVPQRDQDGYWFASYLGGILPSSGDIEDGFYGTKFEIPVREDLDMASFQSSLEKYLDLPPVGVVYTYRQDGSKQTEEYRPTHFGQHIGERDDDSHPAILIQRPGEFNIALDSSDYIPDTRDWSNRDETDTYLLNFAIERNDDSALEFDTLWPNQIQLENEQGLIVAGPHRGQLARNVDELYGDVEDITNPEKPMPDVPLPEPTSSRDQFEKGEALTRFLVYANHLATQEEVKRIADFVNGMFDTDDAADLLKYFRRNTEQYPLFRKMAGKHGKGLSTAYQIWNWFAEQDQFAFDPDDAPTRAIRQTSERYDGSIRYDDNKRARERHPSAHVIETLHRLEESVDRASHGSYGDPDKKNNRSDRYLYDELLNKGKWPIFVGATLNDEKCEVIWNTYPDALVFKTNNYGKWQQPPWNAQLVKDVPLTQSDDHRFRVPDAINDKDRSSGHGISVDSADLDADMKIRTEGKANVQLRGDWQTVHDELVDTDFGDHADSIGGNTLVVFQRGGDEAISDHYDLSGYPGISIVNVTKGQARDLLQFEQVFTVEGLREHIESLSFPAYYPTNGRYYELDTLDLYDTDRRSLLVNSRDTSLAALLQRKDHRECDLWDDRQHYLHGSETMLDDFFSSSTADKDDRVVFYTHDQLRWLRVHFGHFKGGVKNPSPNITFAYAHQRPSSEIRRSYNTRKYSNFSTDLKRTKHPAWGINSFSWKRMDAYKVNAVEKQMYLLARDLDIDPSDFSDHPEQLRYLMQYRSGVNR